MSDPDLLKKLELMANLKLGDEIPPEVAPDSWDWAEAVTKLFADALEEIRRLYADVDALTTNPVVVVDPGLSLKPKPRGLRWVVGDDGVALRSISHPTEPWASPYVMDPKNWK